LNKIKPTSNTAMKNTILFFILTFVLSGLCFSQNALYFKNGDKMSGKLEGYKNDTILFNFNGNKLKFKTADIISVYFNDKDASTDQAREAAVTEIDPSKMGEISGVITYLNRFEFKPDVSTDVYFADIANIKDFNLATLDSFNNYIVYKTFRKSWTPRPANKLIASMYDEGEKYNYAKLNFNLLDKRAAMNISKIVDAQNITKAIVDGNGNYAAKLRPGTYYVLFKSRNSARRDKFETAEWFKCDKINISEGESIKMNYAFGFEYK
jgi:hypothetical protein